MDKRYLYSYNTFCGVYRYQVTRETDSNIWILVGDNEIKISKKTYRIGNGFSAIYYYEETQRLLEDWKKQKLNKLFLGSLDILKNSKSISDDIKKCIIDIAKQIEREANYANKP